MHCRSEIKTSIKVKEDPEGAYTEITVKTTDRPGLLTDIVHNMKDININVISAEVWPPLANTNTSVILEPSIRSGHLCARD